MTDKELAAYKYLDKMKEANITLDELFEYQEKVRLICCYNSGRMYQCYQSNPKNYCWCGCNCFHHEYCKYQKVIYGVCNGCGRTHYAIEDVEDELQKYKWLKREEVK